MTLSKAHKVLQQHDIKWRDYFDLMFINTNDLKVKQAIERIKTFITMGR